MFRAVTEESYMSVGFKGTVTLKYFQTLLQDEIKNHTWGDVGMLYEEGRRREGVEWNRLGE